MKKIYFPALALLFLAAGVQTAWAKRPAPKNDRHVVVLSLDGFRWDYAARTHTPTLDSLRRAGSYAEIYPCFPSNTFPNHYSMATGLHPDHHGIVNNTFQDRATGKWFSMGNDEAVFDPGFWLGDPIWRITERNGLRTAVFMWVGCQIQPEGAKTSRVVPYDGSVPPRQRADWVLEELHRPADSVARLIMWYIEEPDHTAHTTGPDSDAILPVVSRLDSLLTYFFREARTSPVFDKIDFIVTSDHGMAQLAPERRIELYPLLDKERIRNAVNGTTLFLDPEPAYIDEAVRIINAQPHVQAWRREDIPARYHYGTDSLRIMPVVALPQTGWVASYRETARPPSGGNHGFDPFDRQMHMIFYGSGPDFKAGFTQPSFQSLNLHLLIAHLLGVEPAQPNDGDIRPLKKMLRRK